MASNLRELFIECPEGKRRYILHPDPSTQGEQGGTRACLVFDDAAGFWSLGSVSNDPTLPPPIYLPADPQEAIKVCHEDAARRGISEKDYALILCSSMREQNIEHRLKVIEHDEGGYRILKGDGEELITLIDTDQAYRLYVGLAKAIGGVFSLSCKECECIILDDEEPCDQCGCCIGWPSLPAARSSAGFRRAGRTCTAAAAGTAGRGRRCCVAVTPGTPRR